VPPHDQDSRDDEPLWSSLGSMFSSWFSPEATPAAEAQPGLGMDPTADGAAPVMAHWAEAAASSHPDEAADRKQKKAKQESVVYLGINDASREKESAAFKGMTNATLVTGAGTDASMQGKTMSTDGETVLDLSVEADMQRFLQETGVGAVRLGADGKPVETAEDAQQRMATLQDIFLGKRNEDGEREGGLDVGVRDEMAGFLQVLQNVEDGEMTMDRLAISGHSDGNAVYSEAPGWPKITFDQLTAIMNQFPQAQGGVEDLMISACHTLEKKAGTDSGDQYQEMLPNLDTMWGYNGFSPNYKQGSVNHIRNWLAASQGHDSTKVTKAAKKTGQNAKGKIY
jgi:hypothetical protein